jgi:hypothetical protein
MQCIYFVYTHSVAWLVNRFFGWLALTGQISQAASLRYGRVPLCVTVIVTQTGCLLCRRLAVGGTLRGYLRAQFTAQVLCGHGEVRAQT